MATDGSRCMGGSLEEQSLRYHWTVSDEGKRRRKGKKGIVVNQKGVHGDAILRQGRLEVAEAWCRHQDSLLPCSF